jgi:putative ABC transport system permease protein
MEVRLLWASLWRRRGTAALAALAVAIGASVAAALMHVSGDVGAKLTHELRSLGPNLLLAPPDASGERYLDERTVRARLAAAHVTGMPVLYATAHLGAHAIPIAGAELTALARLHPSWKRSGSADGAQLGASLARRFELAPGAHLHISSPEDARALDVRVAGVFEAGGSDDDALWLPLADVQALSGHDGQLSIVQLRIDGGLGEVEQVARRLQRGGGIAALPLHALSATEQGLLDRMRRLMLLVTLAALVAGALSAYGTLTDLALERRREIALLKSIGAPRRRIIGRFLAESLAIGLAGGIAGWVIGAAFALFIGREVFHATLSLQPGVPPKVVGLSVLVALLAAAGPIRLALAVEPARALREDG